MNNTSTYRCIFCLQTDRTFKKRAHIIPESASNKDMVLPEGRECDCCNNKFSGIEQSIIRSFPGQIFRVAFVEQAGRGKKPTATIQGGSITRVDSPIGPAIQIFRYPRNSKTIRDNLESEKITLTWKSAQSLQGRKLSAFLAKLALEYFCHQGVDVYHCEYDHLRNCAKSDDPSFFIPVFIGVHPYRTEAIQLFGTGDAIIGQTFPVLVTFPGFAGIIPTASYLLQKALQKLENFIQQIEPNHFVFITDTTWREPIEVKMSINLGSEEVARQFKKFIGRVV